ncbi:TrkH family potassium uptake protein [Bacteroidota bacterium]
MINIRIILKLLGSLLIIEGIFMLLTIPVSSFYEENSLLFDLSVSSGISLISGIVLWIANRKAESKLGKREGYIIVALSWIVFSFFGCIPFLLTGSIPVFTDAIFETISGFTTTGASILNDIESLPRGILFWRSIIQWLGGMGIIVLSLAVLPILNIGGMSLFVAEVPGLTPDKLHPRIKETAKRLWGIYLFYTMSEAFLLWLGGMDLFDSICHSFTTMATGGYSTKQDSIAHFDSPFIHYVITIFMFLAGLNFALSYFAMKFNFKKVFENEELRYYIGFIVLFTLIISIGLYLIDGKNAENSFREALFQVVSILTTTGFATSDYLNWTPFLWLLLFFIMFIGGSAGSTGGGIKVVRIVLLFKNSFTELKRLLHRSAVIPVLLNKQSISTEVTNNVIAFIIFYLIILALSVIIMSFMGLDFESSFGAVAASLGNIGPGIGSVGPSENFAHIPVFGKWFLSFLMLLGRLELFTILILFTPDFWRK